MRADPDVAATVSSQRANDRARVLPDAERDQVWEIVCDNYSGYAKYQARAGARVIPVVALTPR